MKKRSFFERLAGNLRFDDTEDETIVEQKKEERRPLEQRELSLGKEPVEQAPVAPSEEIGELPVDVYETSSEIIIQTLIAGVMPEHLSINITRDVVTISGKREENKGVSPDAYHIRELYWGSFGRTVELPEEVEIDTAEAIERHGMLIIKLPKIDKKRKAVLKIKSI
jgi:HSP20 family molecular chaperone IbpA